MNCCGHEHERVFKMNFLVIKEDNEVAIDFRIFLLDRHLKDEHGIGGKSDAEIKKAAEQDNLKMAMTGCMADQFLSTFSTFERDSFENFFDRACDYAARYRENPMNFLNMSRKALKKSLIHNNTSLIGHLKLAVAGAHDNQEALIKSDTSFSSIPRTVETKFEDHKTFQWLKLNLGAVTSTIRHTDGDDSNYFNIPLHIWDTRVDGTTGEANAKNFFDACSKFHLSKKHIQHSGMCFDGAIYDKRKPGFMKEMKKQGFQVAEEIGSSCITHGGAKAFNLSAEAIFGYYGLACDGKNPDPTEPSDRVLFFGKEYEKFEESFRTFDIAQKLLSAERKKREFTFADYIHSCAHEDDKNHKEKKAEGTQMINPERTNSIHRRWKSYYFQMDIEYEDKSPLTLLKENDKKMRRFPKKCERMLDNMAYVTMAIKSDKFKGKFEDYSKISEDFEHQLGQWTAIVELLWSINDSSKNGFNASGNRMLMIVTKACLEHVTEKVHQKPMDNVFLRYEKYYLLHFIRKVLFIALYQKSFFLNAESFFF